MKFVGLRGKEANHAATAPNPANKSLYPKGNRSFLTGTLDFGALTWKDIH
jgi:hypothetical protein